MIVKALNTYRIIHKDGTIEDINAVSPSVALDNMTVTEEESPVISFTMVSSDVRTVVEEDDPTDTEDGAPDEEPEEPDTEVEGEVDFNTEGNS